MKTSRVKPLIFLTVSLFALGSSSFAQKPKPKANNAKPIIFAVLNDGKTLEPLANVNKGKLANPVDGGDDQKVIVAFNKANYKPGMVYRLVFGGTDGGSATVKSSDASAECSRNIGTATTKATKTPLKGFVMALATNIPITNKALAYRRKPTVEEKGQIDVLVKNEFIKQKLTPSTLKYHNLTALDVDNDGKPEFVGTYWMDIDKLTRGMLFFIADKGSSGKYELNFTDYRKIDQASVMSGEISAVDVGVYHELLLDTLDYDNDGTGEIFTYVQSFEGSGFNAYKRNGGKWTRVFEGANYHCGY